MSLHLLYTPALCHWPRLHMGDAGANKWAAGLHTLSKEEIVSELHNESTTLMKKKWICCLTTCLSNSYLNHGWISQ